MFSSGETTGRTPAGSLSLLGGEFEYEADFGISWFSEDHYGEDITAGIGFS